MRLILFDVDGTLVDARGAGSRALLMTLEELYGRPFARMAFACRPDRSGDSGRFDGGKRNSSLGSGAGLDLVFGRFPGSCRWRQSGHRHPMPGSTRIWVSWLETPASWGT